MYLPTRAETKNFSLKITKCEQRTIETFINNPLAKDRVFYHLNEPFVSNRTGDIIFSTGIFRTLHTNKHFVKRLADACRKTKLFLDNNGLTGLHNSHPCVIASQSFALTSISFKDLPLLYETIGGSLNILLSNGCC